MNPFKVTQERKPIFGADTMTVSEELDGIPFEKFAKQTKVKAPSVNTRSDTKTAATAAAGSAAAVDMDKSLNKSFPVLT